MRIRCYLSISFLLMLMFQRVTKYSGCLAWIQGNGVGAMYNKWNVAKRGQGWCSGRRPRSRNLPFFLILKKLNLLLPLALSKISITIAGWRMFQTGIRTFSIFPWSGEVSFSCSFPRDYHRAISSRVGHCRPTYRVALLAYVSQDICCRPRHASLCF